MSRRVSLFRLLRPYRAWLALASGAMLVEGAAGLLEPWPIKIVVDQVIGGKAAPAWLGGTPALAHDRVALLDAAAAATIVIAVLGAVATYTGKYVSTSVGQRVTYDLRHVLHHHVQRLSLSFYDQRRTGDMVVRLTSDIDAVQDFVSTMLLGMVLDVLTLAGMLAVMAWLDWRFTLVAVSVTPLLAVLVFRLTPRIRAAARAVKQQESALASVVQETVAAARVVKAFGREADEERRLDAVSQASVDAALRARSVKARLSPLVDVVLAVGTCLVLMAGGRLVLSGRLTTGALLVFVLYLGRMYKPLKDLSKSADVVSKAQVGFERVEELLRTESQVRERPDARPAPRFAGRVELDRVTFGYLPGHPVLRDLSLRVEPGQAVALVGLTGSGKSTLLALLPRLYDVWEGAVRIDGHDVRDFTLQSLRDQISMVLQDPVLFHAPAWQNIAYGRPRATREEIVSAARAANADAFIAALPQGYDTVLGERGETLSAGQRQRIAIARAIVRDTPILLLDEPSAALDPESEELVFDAVRRLTAGRTSITIAHRLATVRRADVILVLDAGRIVERGTHAELLAAGGLYARLYALQFGGAADAAPASLGAMRA